MPFLLVAVLRLCAASVFVLTSAYATLNCSPFAFDMFVRPMLLPWLGQFVAWHHLWFSAAFAVSVCTLPPHLRARASLHSARHKAGHWLAVAYVVLLGVASIALILSPLLPTLWKGDRTLPIALAALVPLLMLAAIDILAAPAASAVNATTTDQRRLLIALSAAAAYLWLAHLLRAIALSDGTGGLLVWVLTSARALLLSGVVFAALYAAGVLIVAVAARTRAPHSTELALTTLALALGVCEFLRRAVFPTISLDPTVAALLATAVGATVAVTGTGLALRRPVSSDVVWSGLERVISPRLSRNGTYAGLVLVPVLAFAGLRAIEQIDWNFIGRRSIIATEGLLLVGFMLSATRGVRSPSTPSWRTVVIPPLTVLALFLGLTPFASRLTAWSGNSALDPQTAFERYATAEAAFRVMTDLVVERPGIDADYYAFLHHHADFSGKTYVTVPDINLQATVVPASYAPSRRPDIFVFVIDSLRRDYLSPYNGAVTFTPSIAAFAAEAFAFQNAYTRHGGTELAISSMWAGAQVVRRVRTGGFSRMNAIEKLVNADGYRIAINDFTVADQLLPSTPVATVDEGVASADTDLCSNLAGLEKQLDDPADSRPVFGFFAPMNVHILNTRNGGPQSVDRDYPGFYAPYASRLERLDACFGRFISDLKRRGRYEDSIIVLTSDHGDSLGENGYWGHATYLFPEDIRIPLVVKVPRALKPALTTDLTRLAFSTDIAPTLYSLLGHRLAPLPPVFGAPLFVDTNATLAERRRLAFLVTSSYGPTYALLRRNGRLLYVSDLLEWRDFAYDLTSEPLGASVPIDAALRRLNQEEIRQQVADLSAFYRFSK
jgi:hypothetical protein